MITIDIGSNHAGEIELAEKIIKAARKAGANFIKLQLFPAEIAGNNIVTPLSWIKTLYKYAQKQDIRAYASHWDLEGMIQSVDCQHDFWPGKTPIVKLAYSQKKNADLWKYAISERCGIIVTTGSNHVDIPAYTNVEKLWANDLSGEIYYPGITEGEDLCPPQAYLRIHGYKGISHHGPIKTPRLAEAVGRGFDLEVHLKHDESINKNIPDSLFSWTPRQLTKFIKMTKEIK